MTANTSFLERLGSGPLLCDGAMGTQLFAYGIGFEQCFDELNLSQPELVMRVHQAYLAAGADLIETNTFGASPIKLREHGLAERTSESTVPACAWRARPIAASGRTAFVLASVGPLGRRLAPLGSLSLAEASAAFREQIQALISAGPDALIIETMSDLNEIRLAVSIAREFTSFRSSRR